MTDTGPLRSARLRGPRGTSGLARRERGRSGTRRGLPAVWEAGSGGAAAELSPPPAPARRSLPLDVARTLPSAMLTASAAPGRLRAGGGERGRRRRRPGRGVSEQGRRWGGRRRARGAGAGRRRELGGCRGEESPSPAPWRQPLSPRCGGTGGTPALGPWGSRPAAAAGGRAWWGAPRLPSRGLGRSRRPPWRWVGGPPGGPEGPGVPPAAGQRRPRPPGPRARGACAPSDGAASAHPGRRGGGRLGAVRAAAEGPDLGGGCRHSGRAGGGTAFGRPALRRVCRAARSGSGCSAAVLELFCTRVVPLPGARTGAPCDIGKATQKWCLGRPCCIWLRGFNLGGCFFFFLKKKKALSEQNWESRFGGWLCLSSEILCCRFDNLKLL